MSSAAVVLTIVVVGLWADGFRHVALAWKAYFGWQLSLPKNQRTPARAVFGPEMRGLTYMLSGCMSEAPPERAAKYTHHMRWFLAELVTFGVVVSAAVAFWPR
jgi:hypothetical protein